MDCVGQAPLMDGVWVPGSVRVKCSGDKADALNGGCAHASWLKV